MAVIMLNPGRLRMSNPGCSRVSMPFWRQAALRLQYRRSVSGNLAEYVARELRSVRLRPRHRPFNRSTHIASRIVCQAGPFRLSKHTWNQEPVNRPNGSRARSFATTSGDLYACVSCPECP